MNIEKEIEKELKKIEFETKRTKEVLPHYIPNEDSYLLRLYLKNILLSLQIIKEFKEEK